MEKISEITVQPQNNNLIISFTQHLQMLMDYLFYRLPEMMQVMTEALFQIIIYQTLK